MADMFSLPASGQVSVLDPGAGAGALCAALCERFATHPNPLAVSLVACERDESLTPVLRDVLRACRERLATVGHKFDFRIVTDDFVLANAHRSKPADLFGSSRVEGGFDLIISNPPYFKIAKDSPSARAVPEFVSGQPNIYALFLGVSAGMLAPGGQFVFISPRSFCAGLYFQRFRRWLVENFAIERIHAFASRNEQFDDDGVLQENVIIKVANRPHADRQSVTVTVSRNKHLGEVDSFKVLASDLIHRKNGDLFLRIPHSREELDAGRLIDALPHTLNELGLEISTGPVVAFRASEFLTDVGRQGDETAPLLWAHNLTDGAVEWPVPKPKKPQELRVSDASRKLLLPTRNYVLIKRFTSKEQERRVYASALLASEFPHPFVGLENHVNYVHRPKGELSEDEALGITALLNSRVFDTYFRTLNGSTQVNATEIRNIPVPDIAAIREIGAQARSRSKKLGKELRTVLTEDVDKWLLPMLKNEG